MKQATQITASILLYLIIEALTIILLPKYINIGTEMVHKSFITHTGMLLLSAGLIYIFQKKQLLQFRIKRIKVKQIFKPIIVTILSLMIINAILSSIIYVLKIDLPNETHVAFSKMNSLQLFFFVFIYASIAEEMLSRGFLQNALHSLKSKGIQIRTIKINLPVIISGILFGLGHLVLYKTGASIHFLIRIVINTTVIGIVAGYFQEKNNNTSFAILVHTTANLPGVIASLFYI